MTQDPLSKLSIDKSSQMVKKGPVRKWHRISVILAVILVLVLVVAFFKGRKVAIETTSVVQVYPTQSFTLLNASGYVVAQRKAAVASKLTGRLEWLGVEEGSRVTAGQVIARLENKDLQAAVRQGEAAVSNARAGLEQARAEEGDASLAFGRQRELLRQGIIAKAEFDTAEARFKRARAAVSGAEAAVRNSSAALSGARVNYDYTLIRAPFDAVVLTKNADAGDIITPLGAAANAKAAVFTIADMDSLQVEADVSEANLGVVYKGQPCEILLDALPKSRFRGEVHTVVPTADRTKASVMVKVRFLDKDPKILPEMSAKVAFLERPASPEEQKPRIAIAPAAIVRVEDREGVFRVNDEIVTFVPVKRGARLGELVEVSGVASGDKVALRPLEKLKNGSRISLPEKK
ncbi:efflux RND transporter periplasmic adaptor subunit [Pelotalea chapellei]|uniref:Efflux RND transporter periplasmic adaptor subunit n=1 Tax=Pelotalea chapellei TaxID=44671 RepID=A0ABS5U421_9BACT|nr:efflux RND transporter periplasmic adaptor subunit [Pelotalea chapellei]MBT1070416.1 efflux RND transporter periplasmic adaptor subunit [Pelotalea chapellei]